MSKAGKKRKRAAPKRALIAAATTAGLIAGSIGAWLGWVFLNKNRGKKRR